MEKSIVTVDDLTVAALGDVVSHRRSLDREPLLDIGDQLNDVQKRLQLVIGAWLFVYEDALGYGAITELAERWDRKPNTLMHWKSIYKQTQNLYRDTDLPDTDLGFGKMQ